MSTGEDGGRRGRWRRLLREARRRRVLRVAAAYVGLFFVLAQAASIFFPALNLPDWTVTWFVALGILGFPLAVGLAWAFDLTREGLVRTESLRDPGHEALAGERDGASRAAEAPGAARADSATPPEVWRLTHGILTRAMELPPAEREDFLDRECGSGTSIRAEVEALLRAHDAPGPLDRLAAEVMTPVMARLRPEGERAPWRGSGASGSGPSPGSSEAGDPLSDRYEILEELGRGGMGVVHRARDLRLDREVALKFLPGFEEGDVARQRFLQEARAAAALDHPNVCTIHEIGEAPDGRLFISMPLYAGETLKRRLSRGAMSWHEAVDVALQVAWGLDRAHRAGIIHRDIKPGNLLLTEEGVAKILDFGIAKTRDATLADEGALLGTPAYMSPEQACGERVDRRSDLWSLGAVLFEMLTGDPLFSGGDVRAIVSAIGADAPVPLGKLRGTAPAPVLRVVERLLARNPAERPPSAGALAELLEQVAEPSPEAEGDPPDEGGLAPEGERRRATVVAVRLAGYPSLLERLDPDELDGRMARLREAARDVAQRHGGALHEFVEDRLVLVFGVPRTREDDPLRAAHAALELRTMAELGAERPGEEPLALRIGAATGTLVARPAGSGSPAYRLAGGPPEAAGRLAEAAPPGEIWLDPETGKGAKGALTLEPAGSVALGEEGVSVEAIRIGSSPDDAAPGVRSSPVRLTRYTGREAELSTLTAAFDRARAGEGQLVTVVGEAGMGKSRLLLELRRRLEEGAARVLRGQCQSYGRTGPYHPFVEVVLQLLRVGSTDTDTREERIVTALRELNPELERFIPFYLHLLSVPSEEFALPRGLRGEQFRAGMREALAALLNLACRIEPLILLLEDWHWVDEASRELLKHVAGGVEAHPLLVVVTLRPGFGMAWDGADPGGLVRLRSLARDQSARFIEDVLGAVEVPEEVASAVHERAGGNPFFLEELCVSLQEAGMLSVVEGRATLSGSPQRLHLPGTIQGVIRTRLDRLPFETREVVRSAAVLGRDFSLSLLARMGPDRYALDRSLDHLISRGTLQEVQVVPERRFRFKHALTQEVAYDTLLQHQRVALHERAGRAMVELHPNRLSEDAPRLAYHFSRAERWMEAVRHGLVAADRARELNELADAQQILEEVDGWLSRLPADRARQELEVKALLWQEEVCETLGLRGRQQELLDRVIALLDQGTDRRLLAEVLRRRGDVYTLIRRFPEAEKALTSALEVAREIGDPTLQGTVLRSFGLTCWHQDRADDGLAYIDEALRLDRERGDRDAIATDLSNRAQILKSRGDLGETLACLEEAQRMLDGVGSDLKKAYVLHNLGIAYRETGNMESALVCLTQAVELAKGRHLPVQQAFHLTTIAHIHLTENRIEEAVSTYEEAIAVSRRSHYAEGLAHSLRPLGDLLVGLGRAEEGLAHLREAARIFGKLGNPEVEADVWRKAAMVAESVGDPGKAREAWTRCRELAEQSGNAERRIEAMDGVGRARREMDPDPDAARSSLEEGLELARSAGARRREAEILNSLGILEWRHGAFDRALERYEEALALFRKLEDRVHTGLILNSLGVTLRAMGRREEARARLREALATHRQSGEALLEGHALAALGDLSMDEGEPDRAREWFARSLEVRTAIGDRRGEGWMHERLARVNTATGRDAAARACLDAARTAAADVGDPELLRACEELTA